LCSSIISPQFKITSWSPSIISMKYMDLHICMSQILHATICMTVILVISLKSLPRPLSTYTSILWFAGNPTEPLSVPTQNSPSRIQQSFCTILRTLFFLQYSKHLFDICNDISNMAIYLPFKDWMSSYSKESNIF
jgi:hypothetical protein